ncbi:unnamed protein product [Adineta ricciae]|uniref:tRNA pseudouridine synthase n=1 Tax=Adineta ricciae TaxID=249248 RepID=A0A813ZZ03_ADIRI|nr:unnamed protein product [Adineta ricciae]
MSNEQINSSKRKFPSDEDQWSTLSREELIQRCKQLDKHVEQLRNTIINIQNDIYFSSSSISVGIIMVLLYKKQHHKLLVTEELNYVQILNGVLPSSIRCTAWAPVPDGKSARFDCVSRSYRYFFPKANLNLDRMRQAAADLIGTHDFRSFCKLDITNDEPTFIRRIDNVTVEQLSIDNDSNNPNFGYQMCELLVHGSGFLWHQIRCIVAILLLIGQEKEDVQLVKELLNIEKYPCTPNYQIASELPLILFDCQFNNVEWICDHSSLRMTIAHLQRHWSSFQIRATMIKTMLNHLESQISDQQQTPILGQLALIENDSHASTGYNNNRKNYQPILTRPVRESVETKVEKFQNKKAKLKTSTDHDDEKNGEA